MTPVFERYRVSTPAQPSIGAATRGARTASGKLFFRVGIFLAPSLALMLLFDYYPAVRSLYGSLTQWNGFSPPTFVGLANYNVYFSSSSAVVDEWRNLAILFFGGLILYTACPLLGAKAVTAIQGRLHRLFKFIIVVPIVVPFVVVINVWAFLLNPASGPVDALITALGGPSLAWYGSPHWALLGILLIGFPWVSGLAFLIYLGGLQAIPEEMREAAQIDRASRWRIFRSVELPLLIPQIRFVIIITGVLLVQNFIPILLLTNGGPGNATIVPGLDMYESAFQNSQYGYGMAIGTLLFIFLMLFTVGVLKFVKPRA